MTTSIGEMSDRARDVFRMVVEAYLESGHPVGSRTISRTSEPQPVARLDPQRHAGSGGIGPARGAAHLGRADPDRERACACSSTASCRSPSRAPRSGRRSRRRLDRGGPIEEAICNATAALSGLSACAGIVLVPKAEPVLRQLAFVPLSPRQAVAVVVGGDGSVENRVVDLPAGRDRLRRWPRSAITSARASPA